MKGTTDPSAVEALGRGLGAVTAGSTGNRRRPLTLRLSKVLERDTSWETFAIYAELSAKLTRDEPADVQIRTIFRLLRHPLSAGEPTTKLLALLEQVAGVKTKFGGDLWKAVEWAEAEQKAGRLKGLDLNAPLQMR